MQKRTLWLLGLTIVGVVVTAIGIGRLVLRTGSTDQPNVQGSGDSNPIAPQVSGEEEVAIGDSADGEEGKTTANRVAGNDLMSASTLEDSVDKLGRVKPGPEANEAVAALARQGDPAVVEIERQLVERQPDFGRQHLAVSVLKEVNSEQSRSLMRRLALGELGGDKPHEHGWAAGALVSCDQGEAWALLASSTLEVLVTALKALEGLPVDDERMALLKTCFDKKDAFAGCLAAGVMAKGCSGKLANEALAVIAEGLTAIAGLPNIDDFPPGWTSHTVGERYYLYYLNALAEMQVDDQALRELTKQLQGRARDVALLALARRGDPSTHDGLIELAQNAEAALLRAWAVNALEEIGTSDDLPLLQTLATTDNLARQGELPAPHPRGKLGATYPVRKAAERTIRAIHMQERTLWLLGLTIVGVVVTAIGIGRLVLRTGSTDQPNVQAP